MNTTKYIDAYILTVPKDKIDLYRKMATFGRDTWMSCGALAYRECIGDDLHPDMGGMMKDTPFPTLTQLGENETVWFSYIEYNSKEHRDEVNKKVNEIMMSKAGDPEWQNMQMRIFSYGGFIAEVVG
jgi:uncharacterized protein YbaA (DUF1428 family)